MPKPFERQKRLKKVFVGRVTEHNIAFNKFDKVFPIESVNRHYKVLEEGLLSRSVGPEKIETSLRFIENYLGALKEFNVVVAKRIRSELRAGMISHESAKTYLGKMINDVKMIENIIRLFRARKN